MRVRHTKACRQNVHTHSTNKQITKQTVLGLPQPEIQKFAAHSPKEDSGTLEIATVSWAVV